MASLFFEYCHPSPGDVDVIAATGLVGKSFLQGLSFDGCSSSQDGFTTPEVHIGGREVRQTLVIPVISVVLEQDAILQRLMPSLYLALRLGHILGLHRGAQPSRDDVTRVVIENGREIEPTPARDLEIGEVGVPIKSCALQFRDGVLTSQALQHYTNLLFG